MATTVTHTSGNGQADPLAATHPRPGSIHDPIVQAALARAEAAADQLLKMTRAQATPASAPAARAARHGRRAIAAWVRGPLARTARRSADITLLLAALTMIAIGFGLAYLPAGFIIGGLGIGYLQVWLATPDQPTIAPPPPRRIDE